MLAKKLGTFTLTLVLLSSCQRNESTEVRNDLDHALTKVLEDLSPTGSSDYFLLPESTDLSNIPSDPLNPLTAEKVALGKMLFHETGLAIHSKTTDGMKTFSCASCHHARAGFQAGVAQGMGDGGIGFGLFGDGRVPDPNYNEDSIDVQQIRSPSAMNSAFQQVTLWNGQFGATGINTGTNSQWTAGTPKETNNLGFEGVETQAIAGLKVHRMDITEALLQELGYIEFFNSVYAAIPLSERYTRVTAGMAIAAYERTLLSNKAPFQQWLRGNAGAMSNQEKYGAVVFFDKGNCGSCHTGPALNSMEFHAYGMKDLCDNVLPIVMRNLNASENKGRGAFTGNPADNFKFKIPQLYNLMNSPHYGHGGNFHTVREVIEYKNAGMPENAAVPASQLAEQFHALQLSDEQVRAITSFISTGLYDTELQRYVPGSLPSGLCFPNADQQSKLDLGCN